MARIHERYLRVKETSEPEAGRPVIRMHRTDLPPDLEWGNNLDVSLDRRNWVTCRLAPAGESGVGYVYFSIHTRGLINHNTVGTNLARNREPCTFFLRKSSRWKAVALGILVTAAAIGIYYLVYYTDLLDKLKF